MATLSPAQVAARRYGGRIRQARTDEEIVLARAEYDRAVIDTRIAEIAELAAVLTDGHREQLVELASA
jgi:hypothetical protein